MDKQNQQNQQHKCCHVGKQNSYTIFYCTKLKPISGLLYADDIILLSESAKGLHKSLDILKTYCDKWNLKVNIGKTKVIVFNKSGRILKGFSFLYDDEPISLTNEYKYLGILFKPSGIFSDAINYLSKNACKAMFCIRKSLYSNKSNIPIHMKRFEACVNHILLYCSKVWSLPQLIKSRDITNFEFNNEKFMPNRIQVKYSKYVLGVHKSATNIAILGELGLYPISLNALKSSVGY
jgi:hypothetical protein